MFLLVDLWFCLMLVFLLLISWCIVFMRCKVCNVSGVLSVEIKNG
uniref:Uncharacterized protein n=1 Tax=Anguilla anguilla TaxID=7936 RepID=A0A0E9W8Q1_ANGAN